MITDILGAAVSLLILCENVIKFTFILAKITYQILISKKETEIISNIEGESYHKLAFLSEKKLLIKSDANNFLMM